MVSYFGEAHRSSRLKLNAENSELTSTTISQKLFKTFADFANKPKDSIEKCLQICKEDLRLLIQQIL